MQAVSFNVNYVCERSNINNHTYPLIVWQYDMSTFFGIFILFKCLTGGTSAKATCFPEWLK